MSKTVRSSDLYMFSLFRVAYLIETSIERGIGLNLPP
jgi:hypothetical protein